MFARAHHFSLSWAIWIKKHPTNLWLKDPFYSPSCTPTSSITLIPIFPNKPFYAPLFPLKKFPEKLFRRDFSEYGNNIIVWYWASEKRDILGHVIVIDFSHWLCLFSCISDSDEGIFLTPLSTHTWFGCGRSLMKSTLLTEQSTFKVVSRLPFEGISYFILLIFDAYTPNDVILVARSRKWRALYWKNEVHFLLHFGFCWNCLCDIHLNFMYAARTASQRT
jgi:hypothetical protein